jgi:hypothetical protein
MAKTENGESGACFSLRGFSSPPPATKNFTRKSTVTLNLKIEKIFFTSPS